VRRAAVAVHNADYVGVYAVSKADIGFGYVWSGCGGHDRKNGMSVAWRRCLRGFV
jgi:hypothetical protein